MMKSLKAILLVIPFLSCPVLIFAQKAYFIDGFHGGMWGHYPIGYTSYIVGQLNRYPDWNINLEIEPETWDREMKVDLAGYNSIKNFLKDSTANSRIEYVNPTYAQPYMFNISGESIIRQFSYGMKALKRHFPSLAFRTYSSEEPCFTSALPQILKSLGYQYASLKNPNTCWGGYTRAYGKELVNWVGPDGSSILTSPRYGMELLKDSSTWETIGNANSRAFVTSAFRDGIKNPVGMCLQDAGWRYGPWLKGDFYKNTAYTTWRNYFENITTVQNPPDWKFSQEDVLTSLVWGAQVLQKLAQQTRASENNIVQAEKIAVIHKLDNGISYPSVVIDDAWRNLMLAQHHDCWIVPYNGKKGDTWADKVKVWTDRTNVISDSIKKSMSSYDFSNDVSYLKVYNTLGTERNEWVKAVLPTGFSNVEHLMVTDRFKNELPSQLVQNNSAILFKAKVPAFGYAIFQIEKGNGKAKGEGSTVAFNKNGDCILETDLYRIHVDKAKGGTIKSLIVKKYAKEFIDGSSQRKFNELRGNFYNKGGFYSNSDKPATIRVLEDGPYLISINIDSEIAGNPVSQVISLKQGQPLIDCRLEINWKGNEGIGDFEETNYQAEALRKAFYDDQFKLLTLFPLNLKKQKVYKNAPFDVTESRLEDTFFNRWDSIKNNIVLNWVDIVSEDQKYGMSLFTDHTTSYTHGKNFPLGLTTQYSGYGLWGRNYTIENFTEINYGLLPHKGNWHQACVSYQNEQIKEPLQVYFVTQKPDKFIKSFIETSSAMLEVTSCSYIDNQLYIRLFNAGGQTTSEKIRFKFDAVKATFVNLDGSEVADANMRANDSGVSEVPLKLKPFGIVTLKVQGNETYMNIPLKNSNEYARDSFATIKK